MSASVIFRNVTKKYKMYKKTSDKILDIVLPNGYGEDFFALQNISFTASPGDVIGIIGVNGAGKSTLSNLISGIIPPTSGNLEINGETSLIAISSGLNNELTGRENIELKCLMLGYSKKQIREITPSIIEFADIGKFIDQPVKKYSSGMKSRLGFAVSVTINPDILVIDEALSVGDQTFTDKCLDKMNEFKDAGKTIFFISHSISQVKKFCNKALWLEAGEVKEYGSIKEVMPNYEKFLKKFKAMSKEEQKNFKQMILEKRNSEKKAEIEQGPEPENSEEYPVENSDYYTTRATKKRLNRKSKLPKILISFCILLLLVAGAYAFQNRSKQVAGSKKKANQQVEVTKKHPKVNNSKQKQDIPKKIDTVYLNVSSAHIHSEPSLTSSDISMTSFGDAFEILDTKPDETDNVDWYKIQNSDGKEGWISSGVVTKISEPMEDEKILPILNEKILPNQNTSELVKVLGKTKDEMTTENTPDGNVEFAYNNEDICNEIIISPNQLYVDNVTEGLGNPQIEVQDKAILYHGTKYDFIFYYSDSNQVTRLYINKLPDASEN